MSSLDSGQAQKRDNCLYEKVKLRLGKRKATLLIDIGRFNDL